MSESPYWQTFERLGVEASRAGAPMRPRFLIHSWKVALGLVALTAVAIVVLAIIGT
jgi:hypothetical protein